jgi:DNA-binding CsgD family transcriptional regulator
VNGVTEEKKATGRSRAWRGLLLYGAFYGICGGMLVTVLRLTEYRFLVLEHSVELYGGLIAALFAGLGIWLGLTLTRKKQVVIREVRVETDGAAAPFAVDDAKVRQFELTPRELEILGQMAAGLSNREIAERLFVSENTVKTHSSRLFDKLGAKRRTQAVRIGKAERLIP